MPIYEYECKQCAHPFQALIMNSDDEKRLLCPRCGSTERKRLISRVSYHMSEQQRLSHFDPASQKDDSFYKDARNIGLHAKKRAQSMGVDLGSAFEEKLDRIRTDPESVIRDSE